MKIAEQISVTILRGTYEGKTLLLDVEEFQPYEPSAYCHSAGWNCAVEIRGETVWFFVDESGLVWDYNDEVGICPAQEREAAKRDRREFDGAF